MMLFVHAILRAADVDVTGATGLKGRPLQAYAAGRVAAICSTCPADDVPRADTTNVFEHERIIERLMRRGPVLPVRFGTVFSGAQKLDEILSRGETAMGAGLDRVEGCVELGLHVLAPHPGGDAAAAANGREYMAARLAAERTRKQLQQGVHEALAPLAIDQAVREPSSSDLLFTAAFLVRHDDVEAFRQRVQDLAAAHPDLRLLCTGPWPPYHFVPGLDDVVAASPAREASHA